MNRRLAAILAADVVGYSRLMRVDEEGTLTAIKTLHAEVLGPTLDGHGGRIVKLMGDGILVELPSALEAVRAAMEIQQAIADAPSSAGITFRIGINLGDVVVENGDIFGDGVNVAARLEAAAPEGGVCISGAVHDQVRDRLATAFTEMGALELKNIDRPVPAWQWVPGAQAVVDTGGPTLPERPSIAVLAFENMSSDPEHDFFGDGLAEDIITGLSKLASLFVIARNSSFTYKGRAVDVRDVGRELGVRYVLEGSVRASGRRLRVTAQLIDTQTGAHVWAERYDRVVEDIFDIQDEITQQICGAMEGALSLEEQRRARLRRPENLDAWSAYHLGVHAHDEAARAEDSAGIAESVRLALAHFERAAMLDPLFARPLAHRAIVLRAQVLQNILRGEAAKDAVDEALRLCGQAIALDAQDSFPHVIRGLLLGMRGDWKGALRCIDAGIALNPNSATGYYERGQARALGLNPEGAVEDFEMAARLSPLDPRMRFRFPLGSWALMRLGRHEEAAEWGETGVRDVRSVMFPAIDAAAAHVALGNHARARELVMEALRRQPDLNAANLRKNLAYAADEDFKEWFIDCLVRSGLPQGD